ncbi:MAG: DUF421 domain-containing protein [Oscillospiraceae bacterium]|nr:DUF421 domain-containing protein [Oscillospiraceae bacterium]
MAIVVLRTVTVFACLVSAMRLMGKRQLGELELSELAVAVLISNMAAHPLQDIGIPLLNGIIPIIVLLSCEILISFLSLKSEKIRTVLFGKPCVIIKNGSICQDEMRKNRFSLDELSEQLRRKDVTDIGSVRCAILETDGSLSVILNSSDQPLTARAAGRPQREGGVPLGLICDGRLQKDNLTRSGKNGAWLRRELEKRNVSRIADVYYMTVDECGDVYFSVKEKRK